MIRFENVALAYGSGPDVLKDVSFEIDHGRLYFLTGPSGAGKTSLLKLIMLALRPTRGSIAMFGEDTQRLSRRKLPAIRRRIGAVFQDFRLLDHLTAYENVALPLRAQGKRERDYRDNVEELLDWVGLGHRLDASPQTLSGGEKQRAAIARAVVTKPDLILADEPTGNVDPEMARRLLHLFVELNRQGTSLLIATHDPSLIPQAGGAPEWRIEDGRLKTA